MSKHTPGPWEISFSPPKTRNDSTTGYEREWVYISGLEHICLATAVWRIDGERSETSEANARLIAAAPDLLEALEKIVEVNGPGRIYKLEELGMLVSTMLSIARAAIAKAKGEE